MRIVKREWRDERGNGGYQDFECVDLDSVHPDEVIAYTYNGGTEVELSSSTTSWRISRARQVSAALALLLDR